MKKTFRITLILFLIMAVVHGQLAKISSDILTGFPGIKHKAEVDEVIIQPALEKKIANTPIVDRKELVSLKHKRIVKSSGFEKKISDLIDGTLPVPIRVPGLTIYQAYESIEFLPGFESEDGAEFTAQIVYYDDPNADADLNWTISKSFDVNGTIISEGKNFYDNTGRILQEQLRVKNRKTNGDLLTEVFASQTINDALSRPAFTTMSAPINSQTFKYKPDFVLNSSGGIYDYRNFDVFNNGTTITDKSYNPEAVGGQTVRGTLGWYYSANNDLEKYFPNTDYPFNRTLFYKDGTGAAKLAGILGETYRIGSGHESSNFTLPVVSELNHYFQIRNKFFSAEVGSTPNSIANNAVQSIVKDESGREIVTITSKDKKVLVKGKMGPFGMTMSNVITLRPVAYQRIFPAGNTWGGSMKGIELIGNGKIFVAQSNDGTSFTNIYTGDINSFVPPVGITNYLKIESDRPFRVNYLLTNSSGDINESCSGCAAESVNTNDPKDIHYFRLSSPSAVTVTGGAYKIYNLSDPAEGEITGFTNGNTLNAGLYKLSVSGRDPVTLTYVNWINDHSYNFYNQLGQLIASIPFEGVKKLAGSGINNYATKNDIPFIKLYEYDVRGRLIKTKTPDGGLSELVYRNDGKLRFSQSAVQKTTGRYSYTNYDSYGRVVESGEFQPDAGGIAFNSNAAVSSPMSGIVENVNVAGELLTGTKRDVVTNQYDLPNNDHGLSGYMQDAANLGNLLSVSKKYKSIVNNVINANDLGSATWYNYDEEGAAVWMISYTVGLGNKTMDLYYDQSKRIVKRVFQKNIAAETFVHYYEYDQETGNIFKVYTNTVDNNSTKLLQATYYDNINGSRKRVELATNLQGIDYTYTLQGELKAINNSDPSKDPGNDGSNGFLQDAFGMVLDYHANDYRNDRTGNVQPIKSINTTGIVPDNFVGLTKAMTWYSKKPLSTPGMPGVESPVTTLYTYDEKDQLVSSIWGNNINYNNTPATFSVTNFNQENIKDPNSGQPAYDGHGNILNLQRVDGLGNVVDKLTYNYTTNSNKLDNVVNTASGTAQTYASYVYDEIGQLINENPADASQKKYIRYDVNGKVTAVARDAAFTQLVVEYVYNEGGARIIKKSFNAAFQLANITYYSGEATYTQTVVSGVGGTIIPQDYDIAGDGDRLGSFSRPSSIYSYELTDQGGNVRALITKNSSSYEVRMYSDYYPFGTQIHGGGSEYPYGFQGKHARKDNETGWFSFELRMYDSKIGRWLSKDPYSQFTSPYLAFANNPISYSDPNGGFATWVGAWLYQRWSGTRGDIVYNGKQYGFNCINCNTGLDEVLWVYEAGQVNIAARRYNQKQRETFLKYEYDHVYEHDKKLPVDHPDRIGKGSGYNLVVDPAGNYHWVWNEAIDYPIVDPVCGIGGLASAASKGLSKIAAKSAVGAGGKALYGQTDDMLKYAARYSEEAGVYSVYIHGNSTLVQWSKDPKIFINHRVLANLIKKNPQYNGEPVKLISCHTGALENGFAKNLANKLGVQVKAPNKTAWVWPDARPVTVGTTSTSRDGAFIDFFPGIK